MGDRSYKINNYNVFNTKTVIYFDFSTNSAKMLRGGDEKSIPITDLAAYLDACQKALVKKYYGEKSRKRIRYLVYVNDLDALIGGVFDGIDGKCIGSKERPNSETPSTIYFVTAKVIYANFNVIANNSPDHYMKMFGVDNYIIAMQKAIDMISCGNWSKAKWSLAHITRRVFYEPIKDHLAQYMTIESELGGYYPDVYEDMLLGNKSGALKKFNGDEDIIRVALRDIDSYDKKSAYPSILVSDNLFPIGKIKRADSKKWGKVDAIAFIASYVQKNEKKSRSVRWIKICTEKGKELKTPYASLFYDRDEDRYAFEIYDLLFYADRGLLFDLLEEIVEKVKFKVYVSESTGYLDRVFRDRVVMMYNRKNRSDISNEERFLLKTQLDMMNGKSIQYHKYRNAGDLIRSMSGNGEMYLRPQHGMHCIAAVRYEILTILHRHQLIAYDTDGIKLYDGRQDKRTDFMHFYNLVIEDKNRLAGYDGCDIGKWKHEYHADIFIQIATKQYIYITSDNHMEIKAAGIPKESIRAAIKRERITKRNDFINYITKNKLTCYIDQLGYIDGVYVIDQKAVEF